MKKITKLVCILLLFLNVGCSWRSSFIVMNERPTKFKVIVQLKENIRYKAPVIDSGNSKKPSCLEVHFPRENKDREIKNSSKIGTLVYFLSPKDKLCVHVENNYFGGQIERDYTSFPIKSIKLVFKNGEIHYKGSEVLRAFKGSNPEWILQTNDKN